MNTVVSTRQGMAFRRAILEPSGLPFVLALAGTLLFGIAIWGIQFWSAAMTGAFVSSAAADIEQGLAMPLRACENIAASLEADPYASKEALRADAEKIMALAPWISGISIAPGAVVRYYFPEAGNEAMIGHDLLSNPARRDVLTDAIQRKTSIVTGPSDPIDSKAHFFVRTPVFNAAASGAGNTGGKAWGFVSISVDCTYFLQEHGPSGSNVRFAIFALDSAPAALPLEKKLLKDAALVSGDASLRACATALASIRLPAGGLWVLAAVPTARMTAILAMSHVLFGLLLGLLYAACLVLFVRSAHTRQADDSFGQTTAAQAKTEALGPRIELEEDSAPPALQAAAQEAFVPCFEFVFDEASAPQPGSANFFLAGERPHFKGPLVAGALFMPEEEADGASAAPEVLAAVSGSASAASEVLAAASGSASAAQLLALPKILVVDDGEVNRTIMARMIESRGYACDLAGGGLEALEYCGRSDYDLVFMDCMMPDMDGYTAAEKLRARQSSQRGTQAMKIIGMGSLLRSDEQERCHAVGMDDFIAKPFTVDALIQKIIGWSAPNSQESAALTAPAASAAPHATYSPHATESRQG